MEKLAVPSSKGQSCLSTGFDSGRGARLYGGVPQIWSKDVSMLGSTAGPFKKKSRPVGSYGDFFEKLHETCGLCSSASGL